MDEYGAVEEAGELEDELLAAMAGAVAALLEGDAPEWHEVNASASSLRAELNAIASRHERPMRDAARSDVERESEVNVEALRGVAGADASPNAMTAAKAAHEAADDVSKVPQAMAQDASRRYLEEAYRAALEARAGKHRPDAVSDAVRRLGERGISCSTYTDRNGRLYRVPVDVGVRRMIETKAMQMMSDQTLEVAAATGQDLVEVSSHIGARPSHAEWQGRVYSLSGKSPKYPKFEDACNVGDMVRGIFGWNCRHHIAIYVEGTQRRWQRDPAKDAGVSNEEAYAARSQQRRYENQIRKLKRAGRALKSQGLDSREVDYKVSALGRSLARHVKEHPYLRRERWREGGASHVAGHNAQKPHDMKSSQVGYHLPDHGAKKNLQDSSDSAYSRMTYSEVEAVNGYTTGAHNVLNPYLYGTYQPGDRETEHEVESIVSSIDDAIGKFNLDADLLAVSGTKAKHYRDWSVGEIRTIDGYFSTSVSRKVAEGFSRGGENSFIISVRVPKGTRCLYIGDNTAYREPQDELLLMHGLSYKVLSKDENGMVLEVVK